MTSLFKIKKFKSWHYDLLVVLILLILPYIIFNGKSFIGGDDSRLYYLYPELFLKNLNLSAWFNFSATGSYNPNFFLLPVLSVAYLLKLVLISSTIVGCLFFSLPLILGYYYFQKLSRTFVKETHADRLEYKVGASVYVFSPILLAGLLGHFLYAVWLIPALPGLYYYLVEYVKTGKFVLVLKACILAIFLSLALYSFPWLFGFLIPVLLAYGFMVFVRHVKTGIKSIYRIIIFGTSILISQSFWLVPFLYSFLPQKGTSYVAATLSKETADTFAATVMATSRGTILYPMLNLFHRQIAVDFNWPLADVYRNYYDKILLISLVYIAVLGIGFWFQRKVLARSERSNYIFLLFALLVSLFLFTVNIGPLKDIYLTFGKIPGFAMFRNGYDKFAPGYVLFYSLLITFSLVVIARAADKNLIPKKIKLGILASLMLVVVINFIPAKAIINRKLWKTDNVGTTITLPKEYLEFMDEVGNKVPNTNNVLSIPYGIALYTTIKDNSSNSVFTGRSPVQIFSGIHDFSGSLSFSSQIGKEVEGYIQGREYDRLIDFLADYNVHYIIETKNIPEQVKSSYLFSEPVIRAQDDEFRSNVYGRSVHKSKDGNYELFELKDMAQESGLFTSSVQHYELQDTNNNDNATKKLRSLYSPTTPISLTEVGVPNAISVRVLGLTNSNIGLNTYYLYRSNDQLRSLKADESSLFLDNSLNIYLDGEQVQNGNKQKVTNFNPNMLVEDTGTYLDYKDLTDNYYTVGADSELSTYEPEIENLLDSPSVMAAQWSNGDCYRYDDFGEQDILASKEGDEEVLKIATNEEHNGCIWKEFLFESNFTYKIQFDYKTKSDELALVITDDKAEVAKKLDLKSTGDSEWTNFKGYYVPKKDEKGLFMLYSGRSKNGSETFYKNLKLTKFKKSNEFDTKNIDLNGLDKVKISPNNDTSSLEFRPDEINRTKSIDNFATWSRANCNAFDGKRDTSEFKTENNSITLSASNNHNACINKSLDINYRDIYKVKLSYELLSENPIQLYVDFGRDFGHQTFKLDDTGTLAVDIRPPVGASKMMFVLYSGQSKSKSTMKYNSIELASYSGMYVDNALVQDLDFEQAPQVSAINKISNHKYLVKMSGVTNNFMLAMNDSYHAGWELKIVGSSKKINTHIPINGYSNGWYVNIADLCKNSENCGLDKDGILELEINFEPQKWFYIGTVITVSFVGLSILVAIVDTVIRRNRKVYQHTEVHSNKTIEE